MRSVSFGFAFFLGASAALSTSVHAADTAAAGTASTGNMVQALLGLVLLLGLMAAAAWALKRFGIAKTNGGTQIKIVGGLSVGSRERILVVEVADQWIVVGVAPGRINTLSTMPRQESVAAPDAAPAAKNFSAWLKQTIEKRDGNQA